MWEIGHAEAIEITFDPEKFHLENFWIFFATRSDYNKSSGNDVGNAIPQ
jgi:peptide methionine sulfoxide reductase MsrA